MQMFLVTARCGNEFEGTSFPVAVVPSLHDAEALIAEIGKWLNEVLEEYGDVSGGHHIFPRGTLRDAVDGHLRSDCGPWCKVPRTPLVKLGSLDSEKYEFDASNLPAPPRGKWMWGEIEYYALVGDEGLQLTVEEIPLLT